MKTRYRFSHRAGNTYYWYSELPLRGESRHICITCPVHWFWGNRHRSDGYYGLQIKEKS